MIILRSHWRHDDKVIVSKFFPVSEKTINLSTQISKRLKYNVYDSYCARSIAKVVSSSIAI